jgi:hypothetical protein
VHALTKVVDVLDRHDVPYAATGSFALTYHATWRFTHDADVKVGVMKDLPERLARVAEDLRAAGFRVLDENAFEYDNFTVEVYPARKDLDRGALRRRFQARLFQSTDRTFWIVTAEDLILLKLREHPHYPASTKHVDDIKTILAARGDLDMTYIEDGLRTHGPLDAWETWVEPE